MSKMQMKRPARPALADEAMKGVPGAPKRPSKVGTKQLKSVVKEIADRKMIEVDKQAVTDLASCVLWALKFLKTPSGTGMHFDPKTVTATPWQEKFDRKDFWAKQNGKKSTKRSRK